MKLKLGIQQLASMSLYASVLLAAASPAIGAGSDAQTFGNWYGNAGGPVGADRITYLSQRGSASVQTNTDTSNWYGRAGGPVGDHAIAVTTARGSAVSATLSRGTPPAWPGRAGGPVGAERISAISGGQEPAKTLAHSGGGSQGK